MTTSRSRPVTSALCSALLAAVTAGCGVSQAVVGAQEIPKEQTDVAPLEPQSAQQIATRVLAKAAEAERATGPDAAAAQEAVLAGAGLATVRARAAAAAARKSPPAAVAQLTPEIVAMSQGNAWPRTILATTLDDKAKVQTLYVLRSAAAREPFKLHAAVQMQPSASIPAIGALADGTPTVANDDGNGMAMAPEAALTGYAAAMSFPAPKPMPQGISVKDGYAAGAAKSSTDQAAGLNGLATFSRKSTPVAESTLALRLANGGAVVFGQFRRVDALSITSAEAQPITIPADYAPLAKTDKAPKSLTLNWLEDVAVVIPPSGEVVGVGAQEQIAGAKAA